MSRKRPAGQIQSSQMLEIASKLMPNATFTDGSIEALRVCQTSFLHQLAHELVALDKFSYTPNDVVEALTSMGMEDIAQEALRRCCCETTAAMSSTTAGELTITTASEGKSAKPSTKARKKKAPKWSQEMEDEQERLLAQTKKDMEQQHMDASQI